MDIGHRGQGVCQRLYTSGVDGLERFDDAKDFIEVSLSLILLFRGQMEPCQACNSGNFLVCESHKTCLIQ